MFLFLLFFCFILQNLLSVKNNHTLIEFLTSARDQTLYLITYLPNSNHKPYHRPNHNHNLASIHGIPLKKLSREQISGHHILVVEFILRQVKIQNWELDSFFFFRNCQEMLNKLNYFQIPLSLELSDSFTF